MQTNTPAQAASYTGPTSLDKPVGRYPPTKLQEIKKQGLEMDFSSDNGSAPQQGSGACEVKVAGLRSPSSGQAREGRIQPRGTRGRVCL